MFRFNCERCNNEKNTVMNLGEMRTYTKMCELVTFATLNPEKKSNAQLYTVTEGCGHLPLCETDAHFIIVDEV